MAITAVPSSAVAQESPARVASPAENERRELTPVAKPSVIARISPEGRLRAEQEQQQPLVAPVDNAVQAAPILESRATAQPQRRTAAEEANAAAEVAALAAPAANVAPVRPSSANNADTTSDATVTSVAATSREPQQPAQSAAPSPPVAVAANVQPPAPPDNQNAAPANPVRRATSEAAQNVSAPTAPAEAEPAPPEQILDPVTLSQTTKDFVAAFNASQANRALVQERAAPVRQAPASDAATLRVAPQASAVELDAGVAAVTPRPEAGSARFDRSTFAAGVARINATEAQTPSQADAVAAATTNESNDTARLVRNDLRGAANQAAVATNNPAASSVDASGRARLEGSVQSAAPAASPDLGTQEPAPSSLAQQLNVLANLLTPGQ